MESGDRKLSSLGEVRLSLFFEDFMVVELLKQYNYIGVKKLPH